MDWNKLAQALNRETDRPPDSFTAQEYCEQFGFESRGSASAYLTSQVKKGLLKSKSVFLGGRHRTLYYL